MKSDIERRFFLAEGIRYEPGEQIDKEVERAAMPGMFNLRDIFQLIVDGLDEGAFT